MTICNWERNTTSPQVHQMPAVIRFLGYDPLPVPKSRADSLKRARQLLGLTQRAMAGRIGIDPMTLGRWERENDAQSGRMPKI